MKFYKIAILPHGFKANAIKAGISKNNRLDLALFYSEVPAKVSAMFTSNKIQANPVRFDKINLRKNDSFRAVIVNSGNANCFTGRKGLKDCFKIASRLAECLNIRKEEVLISSTGIIGKKLPSEKIISNIPQLVRDLSHEGINKAKRAILTTDTFTKEATIEVELKENKIRICGIAKGAGMIAPKLATMLCFIFTDADITKDALDEALKEAVEDSFNCITVDGCMSTNDSIFLLANALAQNKTIKKNTVEFDNFLEALKKITLHLAKKIVEDAEGATKFIQIQVNEARSKTEAREIALAVANSNLFKTAMYGENPNFGRIVSAIGASGVEVKEEKLKINVSSLSQKEIFVRISVARGKASNTVYTSDLTPKYIKINAEYN